MLGVPGRSHERHSRHKGSFSKANEEAAETEAPSSSNSRHTDSHKRPDKHAAGEEDSRGSLCEDNVGGDLREDVAHVEHGDTRRPDRICHVKIFLHACESSVGDVNSIKIAASVSKRNIGRDRMTDFIKSMAVTIGRNFQSSLRTRDFSMAARSSGVLSLMSGYRSRISSRTGATSSYSTSRLMSKDPGFEWTEPVMLIAELCLSQRFQEQLSSVKG